MGEHICNKLEELTEIKSIIKFNETKFKEFNRNLTDIKDDIRLFFDTCNKIFSTKKENDDMKELIFSKLSNIEERINARFDWIKISIDELEADIKKIFYLCFGAIWIAILKTIWL